jgi:hypothetical protein
MADDLDKLRGDVTRAKDGPRVADLRRKISDIVKLSQSGEPEDLARYEKLQPRLRDLTAQLVKLERGDQGGDEPVDLDNATIEKVGDAWRIRSGKVQLAWSFGDRATAERFLDQLKRDEQQPKDIPR